MNSSAIHKALQASLEFQPYEWIYSAHCYIMFGVNSALLLLNAYYLKFIVKKATYDIKPFVTHYLLSCWMMMGVLTLTQQVSMPNIFGNYGIGVLKVGLN